MKTLILYTTKYGFAAKVANLLRDRIPGEVWTINLMKEEVPDLAEFDTVVLGGSIYYGKIQKRMKDFMERAWPVLSEKKVGLYLCAGLPDPEVKAKELREAFPAKLFDHAVCKDVLGDEIVYDKLSWLDKRIVRMMKGSKSGQSNLYLDKVKTFAEALAITISR